MGHVRTEAASTDELWKPVSFRPDGNRLRLDLVYPTTARAQKCVDREGAERLHFLELLNNSAPRVSPARADPAALFQTSHLIYKASALSSIVEYLPTRTLTTEDPVLLP